MTTVGAVAPHKGEEKMTTTLGVTDSTRLNRFARLALICGASGAALLLGGAPALAQSTVPAPAKATSPSTAGEVVVTGTHLRLNGMQTPVPVTAVAAAELKSMAPGNLVEGITQLRNSTTARPRRPPPAGSRAAATAISTYVGWASTGR